MRFFLPTKVYVEENCVSAHAEEIASMGQHALIVTGKRSAEENGSLSDVQTVLSHHGIDWTVFNEVEENPSVGTVLRARDVGVQASANFVIGIGGGSAMDAAKAIALMLRHPKAGMEYMYDRHAITDPVPIICIPTTCGTGAETTANAVLTRHDLRTKGSIPHRLYADLALLDGRYLLEMTHQILMDTTMDALCHLYESYLNVQATDISRMFVNAGLNVWKRNRDLLLKIAMHDAAHACSGNAITSNAESAPLLTIHACNDMLLASTLAGMAVAHSSTTIPHKMSYPLTYEAGIPHGRACGYFLTGFLKEVHAADAEHLLHSAGFECIDDFNTYFEQTSGRDEIPRPILRQAVDFMYADKARLATAPFEADRDTLCRIAGL